MKPVTSKPSHTTAIYPSINGPSRHCRAPTMNEHAAAQPSVPGNLPCKDCPAFVTNQNAAPSAGGALMVRDSPGPLRPRAPPPQALLRCGGDDC